VDNYSLTPIFQDNYFITPIPHDNRISREFLPLLNYEPRTLFLEARAVFFSTGGLTL